MTDAEKKIDENIEKILRAAGSSFMHYSTEKSRKDLRSAMLEIMKESYFVGHDHCEKFYKGTCGL